MSENDLKIIPKQRAVFYDTYANLPATAAEGDLGYASDRKVVYRWTSGAWVSVTVSSQSGLSSAIPTASDLPDNSIYYETDTGSTKQVVSSAWVTINAKSSPVWGVGDTLQQSADTTRSSNVSSYTKVKEIEFTESCPAVRIKFGLWRDVGGAGWGYGRIYLNGVAVGTQRSTLATSQQTYSEDFSAGYVAGDKFQLYYKQDDSTYVDVANFRIYAIKTFPSLEGETLVTPIQVSDTLGLTVNQN